MGRRVVSSFAIRHSPFALSSNTNAALLRAPRSCLSVKRACLVLCRSGNDLLSRVLRHSTIGAEEFNGRVRDGIGFGLLAQITGPAKNKMGLASAKRQRSVPGLDPGISGRFSGLSFHHDHGHGS